MLRKHAVSSQGIVLWIVLLIGTAFSCSNAFAAGADSAALPADKRLARFVAQKHIERYYPESAWNRIDELVARDLEGYVAAYIFIFATPASGLSSIDDLRDHLYEKSALLEQLQLESENADTADINALSAQISKAKNELYNFRNTATIITGAYENEKLILRHFRGIPDILVKAESAMAPASSTGAERSSQINTILMVSPMDFRLLISTTEDNTPQYRAEFPPKSDLAAGKSAVLNVVTGQKTSIGEIKKHHQTIQARKELRFQTLSDNERAQLLESIDKREEAMAAKWQMYRDLKAKEQ